MPGGEALQAQLGVFRAGSLIFASSASSEARQGLGLPGQGEPCDSREALGLGPRLRSETPLSCREGGTEAR
jgi:hypothetical protein